MAREFVERLAALLAPTLAALPSGVTVEIRHFFSGAAAYANDRICISLTGGGLAIPGADRLIKKLPKGIGSVLQGVLGGGTPPPPTSGSTGTGNEPPPRSQPPQQQQKVDPVDLLRDLFKRR